jgi:hypothetical protein
MPTYLEIVKQAFFEKVLTIPNPYGQKPTHRFVAWATKLDGDYGQGRILEIWNPNDRPAQPYNLVLSLASNGKHYPLIDWDSPDRPVAKPGETPLGVVLSTSNIWFRSGSGNWHGYCNGYNCDAPTAALVAKHPFVLEAPNVSYMHVKRNGYATLRPPWLPKGGWQETPLPDAFPDGFLDGIQQPEPERNAWEELFND